MLVKGCCCLLHSELLGIPVTGRANLHHPKAARVFSVKYTSGFLSSPKSHAYQTEWEKKKKKKRGWRKSKCKIMYLELSKIFPWSFLTSLWTRWRNTHWKIVLLYEWMAGRPFNSKSWLKDWGLTQEKSLEACCKLSLMGLFMALRKKQAYLSKVKMCPQKRRKHSTSEKKNTKKYQ